MTRAELEILLCDYVDGTLAPEQRAAVERHLAENPNDAEMVNDALEAHRLLAGSPRVEVPAELLTRILFDIRNEVQPRAEDPDSFWAQLRTWFGPILQPRFAMGMAMTILSFSMLGQLFGIQFRQLTADDLKPAAVFESVENRAVRTWDRVQKFYEDLRFVYKIQTFLREWSQTTPVEQGSESQIPESGTGDPSGEGAGSTGAAQPGREQQ